MPPVPALSAKANISASSAAMVANVAACAGTGWLTLRSTEKSCSWPVMPSAPPAIPFRRSHFPSGLAL